MEEPVRSSDLTNRLSPYAGRPAESIRRGKELALVRFVCYSDGCVREPGTLLVMQSLSLPSWIALVLTLGLSLFAAGCGGAAKTKIDTAEVVSAFAAAEAPVKAEVDAAAKLLMSGKLKDGTLAFAALTKTHAESLSEPQKDALLSLVTMVQTVMAEDADKLDMDVFQATDDIMAALEGRESMKVGVTPDSDRVRTVPAR